MKSFLCCPSDNCRRNFELDTLKNSKDVLHDGGDRVKSTVRRVELHSTLLKPRTGHPASGELKGKHWEQHGREFSSSTVCEVRQGR